MANLDSISGLHYEMIRRCYSKNSVMYNSYGAKGIDVCPEWHNRKVFKEWCINNGWKKGLRLNRIDSAKGYSPENCFFGNYFCKIPNGKNQIIKKRIIENKKKKQEAEINGSISKDPLYRAYVAMHNRCENELNDNYNNYGARGIAVCEEWSGKDGFFNFKKWCNDNKWIKGLTVDRIDNNKGYSPDNCRLVNITMQANNKRNTIYCDYLGIKVPLGIIAKNENVKYGLLYCRVRKNGMSASEALADIKQKYS